LPATNTTGDYLLGKCPSCAGRAHAGCVDGHARNCVRPGEVWPTDASSWSSEDNCHTSTRSTICVVPRLTYLGYATWSQTASSQSDAAQDAAMDAACDSAYSGSRAATIDEIVRGTIQGMPSSNTSSRYLLGKCPSCEGATHSGCVDGHARNCVPPGEAWPTTASPWPTEDFCHTSTRSALCVQTLACPFRGFASWSQTASSQSDVEQDTAMDAACDSAYSGSAAATMEELVSGTISGLPATNTTSRWALGRCPQCEGASHAACVDGHARNCVSPGDAWPTTASPWPTEDNCHSATRTAVCF